MLIPKEYNRSSIPVNNYSSLTAYERGYMLASMKYGERLRRARIHADLTQTQLADKIKNVCTQENISKLERGDATGSEFTAQLAAACGVNPMWLAAEDGEMLPAAYSTSDPTLVEILKALEPRAEYFKETALKNVLNTLDAVDHAQVQEEPKPLPARPADMNTYRPPSARRGLHFYGGPADAEEKKNDEKK